MCGKCQELVTKYYSHLSEDERVKLLMSATSFPFGSIEQLIKELTELRDKTDGTLHGAIVFACDQADRIWEETREERERDSE